MSDSLTQAKILIVEDEPQINRLIELVLFSGGYYKILKAFDGIEALEVIKKERPDLVLLDVMIPLLDGFSVCKEIKSIPELSSIQVIMLTARKMEEDVLKGFENGAIDYISKPFSNKILLARIKAHLENCKFNSSDKYYKDIVLDEIKRTVKVTGELVDLTKFEFEILSNFISNIGRVFSRAQLLQNLRGDEGSDISERAVDVQIVNLRRKLGMMGKNIETVRGIGYKLRELE